VKIAFIGTGKFGLAIASSLLEQGFDLYLLNINGHGLERSRRFCESHPTVGFSHTLHPETSVILSSLPDGPALLEAIKVTLSSPGPELWLDLSTAAPKEAEKAFAVCEKMQCKFVDAPVSGSIVQARQGKLACFLGTLESDSPHLKQIVSAIAGEKAFYFSSCGKGYGAKSVNQYIHISNLIVLSEGFHFASSQHLDSSLLLRALKESSSSSQMMLRFGDDLIDGAHEPHFTVRQALKDLKIVRSITSPTPPGLEMAISKLEQAESAGLGERNFSAVHLVR
jgi:3-hydroxyisobutyrate dehydrogenase-like beta-hydroxyacid dehydrogenase